MQTVYFAHANGFPSATYGKLFRNLSPRYRVESLPMVGHDPSFPVRSNWRTLSRELIQDLERRRVGPVVGVGHSLGGVLTLLAVSRRPDLFRAYMMLDPPVVLGLAASVIALARRTPLIDRLTPAGKSRNRRRHWPNAETAYDSLRARGIFRDFDPECLGDYVSEGIVPDDGGVRLRFDPDVETRIFRTLPHDLGRLRAIGGVPGGVIVASRESAARPCDVRRLVRRHQLLSSTIRGGHMFPFERPTATATAISEMVGRLLHRSGQVRRAE